MRVGFDRIYEGTSNVQLLTIGEFFSSEGGSEELETDDAGVRAGKFITKEHS